VRRFKRLKPSHKDSRAAMNTIGEACVPAQPHIFHNVHSSTKHQGDPPTTAGTAPGVLFGPYLVYF
jgi:hypothetical protein